MVAVLFVREDSVYKSIPGVDAWDIVRDARRYPGGRPVVAHPPCRSWGRLRHFAKPVPGEKELALFAVECVRRCGGVLEHPEASSLWAAAGLPRPGEGVDAFGGWTLPVSQLWWGHRAEKRTWLYIIGVSMEDLPQIPFYFGYPSRFVAASSGFRKGHPGWKPCMSTAEREATPPGFAAWLVEVARRSVEACA